MNEFVNYGMKEIKPSFKDRVNNFIVMHPIIVALVIMFVISLMFGGCQRAKAEEMNSSLRSEVESVLSTYSVDWQQYSSYFDDIFASCPYVMAYKLSFNDTYIVIFDFYYIDNIGFKNINNSNGFQFYTSRVSINGSYFSTIIDSNVSSFSLGTSYRAIFSSRHQLCRIFKVPVTYSSLSVYSNQYGLLNMIGGVDWTTIVRGPDVNYIGDAASSFSIDEIYVKYGNIPFNTSRMIVTYPDDTWSSITSSTEGFKVYKQSIHNQEFLMIDFSDCVAWNLMGNSDLYVSNASFDLNVGSDTHLFELDEQSYYHYNFNSKRAYWQIPFSAFSAFGFDDASLVTVSNVVVDFGFVAGMPMNYTANFIGTVTLKGSSDSNLLPPSSDTLVQEDDYNPTILLNVTNSVLESYSQSVFDYELVPDYTTVLSGLADYIIIDAWYWDNSPTLYEANKQPDAEFQIANYLYDNSFALFYDAIILHVFHHTTDGADATRPAGYVVFYTHRYYLRNGILALNTNLTTLIEYERLSKNYLYDLYSFTFDKLGNIDQNTYEFFVAALAHNSAVEGFLSNIYGALGGLDNLLGRILDALADLHLDQLDTIDAKLTTIISNMGQSGGGGSVSVPDEDDTIEEAIKYYLLCEDSIGVERAIFEDKFSVWFTGKWHLWLQGKKENGTAPEDNHFFIIGESVELVTNAYDFLTSEPYFWRLFSSWFDSLAGNDNGGEFNQYLTTFGKGHYNPDHYNGINE